MDKAEACLYGMLGFAVGMVFMCFIAYLHSDPICRTEGSVQICTDYWQVTKPYIKEQK